MRERVNAFLEDNFDIIKADFKLLEPKDKLLFYTKLLAFGLPTLKAVEGSIEIKNSLDSLTDEQLNGLVQEILNKADE